MIPVMTRDPAHDIASESHATVPTSADIDQASLAERLAQVQATLEATRSRANTAAERASLKASIVALFREAEAAVREAQALKDAVKGLAGTWKQLASDAGDAPSTAATTTNTGNAPSLRVDHLGASTFVEKGWSRLSLGDAPAAEEALRRALTLAPASNEAETLLGWALMLQERFDEALVLFQGVLQRDPAHALARANVGYVCLRKGIYGEAIEHLSSAIRAGTDRKATLYAHLYLGMVYAEREMHDDAILFYRRALELGPNLLQAWYELGRVHWRAGRVDEARAAWRAGAEANKFSPWGKRCAEVLATVEQGGAPPRD